MDDTLPDLSAGIPVFPLPGMALFPHTHLPLHIFEERYRNLVEDTLHKPNHEHCFAMGSALPDGAHDTVGKPPVFRYAGVGRIVEYSRVPDGRFMLVLRGLGRVRLGNEHEPVNGYRLFSAEWLPDVHTSQGGGWEANLGLELKALALTLLREQAERFRELMADEIDLGALTDMICGYLPLPPEFKLEQIATANVIERAAATISHLERLLEHAPAKPIKPDDAPAKN
jgi:uncharacterized protein